jgi:hypothetical protein
MHVMAKKQKRPTTPRDGYNVNVWINPAVGAVVENDIHTSRLKVSKTAIVELALIEYYERQGKWPAK